MFASAGPVAVTGRLRIRVAPRLSDLTAALQTQNTGRRNFSLDINADDLALSSLLGMEAATFRRWPASQGSIRYHDGRVGRQGGVEAL